MGDQHPLLLSAGQAADPLIGELRRPTARASRRPSADAPARETGPPTGCHQHRVPRDREHASAYRFRGTFLRHVTDRGRFAAAVDGNAAAAGTDKAEDGAQQGCLARAIAADQPAEFAVSPVRMRCPREPGGQRKRRLSQVRENFAPVIRAQCPFCKVSVGDFSLTALRWRRLRPPSRSDSYSLARASSRRPRRSV